MSLDADQVRRIAFLARVAISESEATAARNQLNDIFAMIEKMQAVDTRSIEPMVHGQDVKLRLREDIATEADQRALFQTIAPQIQSGFYLVPKVIE